MCRSTGIVSRRWLVDLIEGVAELVKDDLANLCAGNVHPTAGDMRCIAYGHLIRLAVWNLRKTWDRKLDIGKRLSVVSSWLVKFGGWSEIEKYLNEPENRSQPKDTRSTHCAHPAQGFQDKVKFKFSYPLHIAAIGVLVILAKYMHFDSKPSNINLFLGNIILNLH